MKKFLKAWLHTALSTFEWYRKKKGGKWYKVHDASSAGGIEGPITIWTQYPSNQEGEVIAVEEW